MGESTSSNLIKLLTHYYSVYTDWSSLIVILSSILLIINLQIVDYVGRGGCGGSGGGGGVLPVWQEVEL